MKKILCMLLTFLLCLFAGLTGCGKSNTPYYDQWLNEQVRINAQKPDIWLYGTDAEEFKHVFTKYNYWMTEAGTPEKKCNVTFFSELEYDVEAYKTKLQAAIMSGEGPDLILSSDPSLLTDMKKVIKAGAAHPWDEYIKAWSNDEYYFSVLDGCRSEDGMLYLMPLAINPHLIVTTKTNMEKYDLSAEDFSDADTALDTMLRLAEQTEEEHGKHIARSSCPPLISIFPELYGETKPLSFSDPLVSKRIEKCKALSKQKQIKCSERSIFPATIGAFLSDQIVLDFTTLDIFLSDLYMSELDEAKLQWLENELVLFPCNNVNGACSADVTVYAIIPRNSKSPELAFNIIDIMTKDRGQLTQYEFAPINKNEFKLMYQCGFDMVTSLSPDIAAAVDRILKMPIQGYVVSESCTNYLNQIGNGITDADFDWSELERSINIYLSE